MTVYYDVIPWVWRPLRKEHEERLSSVLWSWYDTPYRAGGTVKKAGVDCVRFVCSVLDEWLGRESFDLDRLPQDTAMHDAEGAHQVMRTLLRRYEPVDHVADMTLSPGDIIVTGSAGPGHAIIAGARKNTLWQASTDSVHFTGIAFARGQQHVFAHYRIREAAAWS